MTLPTKKLFLQREEKILVAIDVSIRKIEKLSLVTKLCYQLMLIEENDGDFTSFSVPSKPLESVLGKEIHGTLEQLVSVLKMVENGSPTPEEFSTLRSLMPAAEETVSTKTSELEEQKLICNLRQNSDKREFCSKIMENSEIFLKDNSPPLPSSSVLSSDTVTNSTVQGLLHEAMSGKYREHVRRCFRERDVESLISILYLVAHSSPDKEERSAKILPEVDEEVESFYFVQSPSPTSTSSRSIVRWNSNNDDDIIEEGEKEPHGNWKFEEISYEIEELFEHARDDVLVDADVPELSSAPTSEIVTLYNKLMLCSYPMNLAKRVVKVDGGVQNFLKFLHELRSVVSHCMHYSPPGLSTLEIKCSLLKLEKEKIQNKLVEANIQEQAQHDKLDGQVNEWNRLVTLAKDQTSEKIKGSIKEYIIDEIKQEKQLEQEIRRATREVTEVEESLSEAVSYVRKCTKTLRARRHWLEASLEALIRQYNSTMAKYQVDMDELGVEETTNAKEIERLQKRFAFVEEQHDEMKAMRRLKEIMANMEKAEAIKQNWAARKIQTAWRKYKVAKLRKKKLKGRKKGKKKTPPPNQGKAPSPGKISGSTPTSRSKSRSKTP